MGVNVGQLIREGNSVNEKLFNCLEDIHDQITSSGILQDFEYSNVTDPRINSVEWVSILHAEFLQLYKWALRRIIYSQIQKGNSRINNVVCFQPYYGVCLHYIRRVLPFVLLGMEVKVVFSDEYFKENIKIIQGLNDFLGITNITVLKKTHVNDLEDSFDQMFLVTGKKGTFDYLQTKYLNTIIVGAVGEKAVLITKATASNHQEFSRIDPSCTNVDLSFIISNDKLIDKDGTNYSFDHITELNPTIIYTDMDLQDHDPFRFYKVINYFEKNTYQLEGICADPKHGYPGDYLI